MARSRALPVQGEGAASPRRDRVAAARGWMLAVWGMVVCLGCAGGQAAPGPTGPATSVACAAAAPASDAELQATKAQLTQLADAWDQAIVRKDRAGIEGNMAEDFRQIDGGANLETKASFVEGLLSDALQIDPYTIEDFEIRLYGEVALISGRTRMTGRYEGEPFTSHYRYIDTYVRRAGAWKIVSVQITRVPQ